MLCKCDYICKEDSSEINRVISSAYTVEPVNVDMG